MNTLRYSLVLCISLHSISFISAENLLHKDDNWWKEFVHDGAPPEALPGSTNIDLAGLGNQESWFSKNKDRIYYWGSIVITGYGCFKFGKWWSGSLLARMRKQLEIEEQESEVPVINDQVRQIVGIEMMVNDPLNAELKGTIDRGDVDGAKYLINDQKRLGLLVENFDEAHTVLAAIKAEYHCPMCFDHIADARKFQVGSSNCFHFICAPCKANWRGECRNRSEGYRCLVCRQ